MSKEIETDLKNVFIQWGREASGEIVQEAVLIGTATMRAQEILAAGRVKPARRGEESLQPNLEIQSQVIRAFIKIAPAQVRTQSKALTTDLAEDFNREVGGGLLDQTKISDLRVPTLEGNLRSTPNQRELAAQLTSIDKKTRAKFNQLLRALGEGGIETVGAFRDTKGRIHGLGPVGQTFAEIAFRRRAI